MTVLENVSYEVTREWLEIEILSEDQLHDEGVIYKNIIFPEHLFCWVQLFIWSWKKIQTMKIIMIYCINGSEKF